MTKTPRFAIALAAALILTIGSAGAVTHRNVVKPGAGCGDPTCQATSGKANNGHQDGSSSGSGSGGLLSSLSRRMASSMPTKSAAVFTSIVAA